MNITDMHEPPASPAPRPDDYLDGFVRARSEEHGIDAGALRAFFAEAEAMGVEFNSHMIWHAGAIIDEGWRWPYRPELPHMMHSATKSFLSAAVGIAIAEGRFALQDRVISFFPDELPGVVSPNLAAMTVEDLLTQTSGHAQGASGSVWRSIPTSWVAEFFKIPVSFRPGERFRYSSATSFMLSAIISRTTGQNAHAFLKPRLLDPLGIEELGWDVGPGGINPGGNGISARTADLLKLAVLHQRGGCWNGEQLLDADWVRAATSPKRGNAHGYHWWIGPGGSFYAYGVFGQFAFVFPEQDAIVAMTASVPYGEETLRSLVWHHFPAAFGPGNAGRRIAASPPPVPTAPETGPALPIPNGCWIAEPNDDGIVSVSLSFEDDACRFTLVDGRGTHRIDVGTRNWIEGFTTMSGAKLHHGYDPERLRVIAGGRWTAPHTFEMDWHFVETAFRDSVTLRFTDGTATLDRQVNVNSGLALRPTIRLIAQATTSPFVSNIAEKVLPLRRT